jgi:hypothetical protein
MLAIIIAPMTANTIAAPGRSRIEAPAETAHARGHDVRRRPERRENDARQPEERGEGAIPAVAADEPRGEVEHRRADRHAERVPARAHASATSAWRDAYISDHAPPARRDQREDGEEQTRAARPATPQHSRAEEQGRGRRERRGHCESARGVGVRNEE